MAYVEYVLVLLLNTMSPGLSKQDLRKLVTIYKTASYFPQHKSTESLGDKILNKYDLCFIMQENLPRQEVFPFVDTTNIDWNTQFKSMVVIGLLSLTKDL